ncbi:hypothetical protein M434DRAFT_394659 [Hypoxylon sp. CO27-5]|nr:hypothetical protein M434DRAFT_394659 [Hypoxylon sp. CO27-5]
MQRDTETEENECWARTAAVPVEVRHALDAILGIALLTLVLVVCATHQCSRMTTSQISKLRLAWIARTGVGVRIKHRSRVLVDEYLA